MKDKDIIKLFLSVSLNKRRDSLKRWEEYNPVLSENDIAIVLDENSELTGLKLGAGKPFSETPYFWKDGEDTSDEIVIEGRKFRRSDIYDIYECERDKRNFLNREAGFIVKTYGDKDNEPQLFKYGEPIAYESYPHEIAAKKHKWDVKMKKYIDLWKNKN